METSSTQLQLKPVFPRNPPVFGGFINEDVNTKSDSSKASSDIEVANCKAYSFNTFLMDAGCHHNDQDICRVLLDAGFTSWTDFLQAALSLLDIEPEMAQNLIFQAQLYNAMKM
ncbi:hypothetical protein CROQUDRAFT_93843 [Cronartium quercuum f. sp. fusiforme G11]|uniref:Uncharacterized protein n=1 Tax=Cronartium quercuum f. sp. fusiforme G11 TaxID=708437 RepID=A0A9P6NJV3_9BASI|nr:hypothetical protein CROQUDRAFT_93843 [Cronartium quercuum f. sp. fusiforme G11]